VVKTQTAVHERVTRNNKPMPTMNEMNDKTDPKPLMEQPTQTTAKYAQT
jgi:hypothetical protein